MVALYKLRIIRQQGNNLFTNKAYMSDSLTLEAPATEQVQTPEVDVNAAFNGIEAPIKQDGSIDNPPPPKKEDEEVFDEITYIKNNFGWETPDAGKAELEELRKLKTLPKQEPFAYANEESRKIAEYINTGKKSDLLKVLAAQEKLSQVTSYDLSKAEQASEIIKLGMLYKNQDLSPDDVDFLFNKKFTLPIKPEKTEDKDETEYAQELSIWEKQVSLVEREMIIEAKLAKPDLAKYQSELVLPDIQVANPIDLEAQQKELERGKAARTTYLQKLESDYKKFGGFSATYKDEEGEIQSSYKVPEPEIIALKEQLQNFDKDKFIDDLWFNEDGSPKVEQIMSDVYYLKNREKITQKLVNEAVAQRLLAYRKQTSNVNFDKQSDGTFQPSEKSKQQLQEDAIWSA